MCDIKIRPIDKEDLHSVQDIERISFKDPYPSSLMAFLFRVNKSLFLVAEKKHKIVGYIITSNEDNIGHIISIAIDPSEKRKHIGLRLMEEIFNILKKSKTPVVRLEVRKSNVEAQKFYEAIGFVYSYTIENYYGDEEGLIYFRTL